MRLYGYLKVGPYEVDAVDEDMDYHAGGGVRVMGIAYPVERYEFRISFDSRLISFSSFFSDQASFCAIVDGEGAVIDHVRLVHLMKRKNARRNEESRLKVGVFSRLVCC